MKHLLKKVPLFVIILTMAVLSVIHCFAATEYLVNGYSYNVLTNSSIALCGWDNSAPELIVPESIAGRHVTAIADDAFRSNTEITTVNFSEATALTTIGFDAFNGCTSLQGELDIPESIALIKMRAFMDCSSLQSAVIKAKISKISEQAFYNCGSLSSVSLPDTVTVIDNYAFANCPNLTYVEIPASVEVIYRSAFVNDSNVTFGVYFNSYAHQFAKDNNIPYKLLDEFKLGDVNMDGYVNINDATSIQRNLAELEQFNELQELTADANCDKEIDISDATAIQMFSAEYVLPYPIGEIITA